MEILEASTNVLGISLVTVAEVLQTVWGVNRLSQKIWPILSHI
jgi:hypothetical protein